MPMSREQYLLLKLNEECIEVAKECSKAIQFGLDEVYEPIGKTNRERIISEMNDLAAVIEMLSDAGLIHFTINKKAVDKKKEKVEYYAQYSKDLNKLEKE